MKNICTVSLQLGLGLAEALKAPANAHIKVVGHRVYRYHQMPEEEVDTRLIPTIYGPEINIKTTNLEQFNIDHYSFFAGYDPEINTLFILIITRVNNREI